MRYPFDHRRWDRLSGDQGFYNGIKRHLGLNRIRLGRMHSAIVEAVLESFLPLLERIFHELPFQPLSKPAIIFIRRSPGQLIVDGHTVEQTVSEYIQAFREMRLGKLAQ